MRSRAIWTCVCFSMLASAVAAGALEFREEPYRVGIVDVGDPVLLNYTELTNEMNSNTELRDWVEAYGRPEYAEYQRVGLDDPFLPYEIRLYYIEGRSYVAFGRVHVSPAAPDFGVRKYIGKLDSAILQRLLTAKPLQEEPREVTASASSATYYDDGSSPGDAELMPPMPEGVLVGEEVVIEEVIEMPAGEEVVIVESQVPQVVEVEVEADEVIIEVVEDGDPAANPGN